MNSPGKKLAAGFGMTGAFFLAGATQAALAAADQSPAQNTQTITAQSATNTGAKTGIIRQVTGGSGCGAACRGGRRHHN